MSRVCVLSRRISKYMPQGGTPLSLTRLRINIHPSIEQVETHTHYTHKDVNANDCVYIRYGYKYITVKYTYLSVMCGIHVSVCLLYMKQLLLWQYISHQSVLTE